MLVLHQWLGWSLAGSRLLLQVLTRWRLIQFCLCMRIRIILVGLQVPFRLRCSVTSSSFVHEKELASGVTKTLHLAPDAFKPFFEVVQNAFNAYGDKLMPFREEAILPGIQTVELFGHTPAILAIYWVMKKSRC